MRRFVSAQQFRRFLYLQDGATAIEYALIAAGIAAALVATINALGGTVSSMWSAVATALS